MTMQPLTELKKGLEILEPFLKQHNFGFNSYENFKASNGQFILAKYKKERKEFILGYHCSIGQVVYQFDKFTISHDFYLDKLGFGEKKQFKDNQTTNKFLAFTNILNDFNFLVDDFFEGNCIKLKQFSRLQENIITEYDKKAREGFNLEFDKLRIEKARLEFRKKDFRKSLEIYKSIEYKNLINELDERVIEYCKRHIIIV